MKYLEAIQTAQRYQCKFRFDPNTTISEEDEKAKTKAPENEHRFKEMVRYLTLPFQNENEEGTRLLKVLLDSWKNEHMHL